MQAVRIAPVEGEQRMEFLIVKTRSVLLIGTSHRYQLAENPADSEFGYFVKRAAGAFEVRAIAEESSHEVLAQYHAVQSVCEQIAHAMGIAHRYCDPDSRQRQALDIRHERDIRLDAFFNGWETDERRLEREIRASYAARERYWLNQLTDLDCWPVLFVCGANHVEHFGCNIQSSNLHAEVVAFDWPELRINFAIKHSGKH